MPPCTFTLTGCITIEDGSDQNGFLKAVQDEYENTYRHTGNATALKKLTGCTEVEAVMVGHAREGKLLTANGDVVGNPGEYTEATTDFTALQGTRVLRLVGCKTGAGKQGARLLNELARDIGGAVLAPTGDVFFGTPCDRASGVNAA